MKSILMIAIGVSLFSGGGCASKSASSTIDRSAIRVGMTEQEVDDLMRPVARDRAVDHRGNQTGVRYDTGDRFVFEDGRLQSHTRD